MSGIQIITDKNHCNTEVELFNSVNLSRATVLNFSDDALTDFQGFGVAITGSSCYNLSLMEDKERTELLKKIYSKDGMNLSVGRLTIASSDYSAELYSYDDVPFDTELKHFSIEHDERYIIPMIKEILKVRPDLYIFASPWSPPGWMKTGENIGGGYMRNEFIDCYAEYIIKFIKAYAENGIKISAITPQNEPETTESGTMPACNWHPETEANFIKILKKKFKENNLDVKIWMYDHNFSGADRVLWSLENYENLEDACDGIAFHYYEGTIEETIKVREKFPNLKLHFTEAGPRLHDNYGTDWCKWGIMITKAIKCGYSSFTGWNLMLNEMGGPNVGPFLCGGLVTRNCDTKELSFSGQFRAFERIAKYINANSKIYPVSVSREFAWNMFMYPKANNDIEGFMIKNDGQKNVVVLINPNEGKRQVQFLSDGKWHYAELTPESISTLIIG